MKRSKIIYSLNVEDMQTAALEVVERKLSPEEIEIIKESIADKINWYDAIADSISEHIKV